MGRCPRDGRRVAVGDFSRLRILDAATGRAERTIELPGSWGRRPAFSPDGTLVAMPIDNTIGLFEVSTGRRLHHDESTPVGNVVSAAWSPSGDRIVTGHDDGIRAGLGRRDRQADLAQAPGTRDQPERLERPCRRS